MRFAAPDGTPVEAHQLHVLPVTGTIAVADTTDRRDLVRAVVHSLGVSP